MSTTLSMWFGIAFVILGVTAVLLQAWLWNPRFWDENKKRTHAPPFWLGVHRIVGYTFFAIYVAMMWNMVPRLWEYQVELPARTIVHATAAIVLGVLLVTKISILRWFRYFEEAMPRLGMGILVCTTVIGSLSLPFAARGHGFGAPELDEENRGRVERILAEVDLGDVASLDTLLSGDGLSRGREVLVTQCVRCHDMRTILARPRTGNGWHKVIDRMTEKPSVFGEPIQPADVPYVTAYMVSITPQIQESAKGTRKEERSKEKLLSQLVGGVFGSLPGAEEPTTSVGPAPADAEEPTVTGETPPAPPTEPTEDDTPGAPTPGGDEPTTAEEPKAAPKPRPRPEPKRPAAPAVDEARAKKLLESRCTECHELDEVDAHGDDSVAGWSEVVRAMVDEGAEITEAEARILVRFLAARK